MNKRIFTIIACFTFSLMLIAQSKPSVTIFGDSYSTFEGYVTPDSMELWYFKGKTLNRTDVVDVKQTWWWQLIKEKGWKLERNNSWSGATISYTGYDKKDYHFKSFITRLDNLGNPDIILLFGATNDAWAGSPIGEYKYSDFQDSDFYAFRPAFSYLLEQLQERYPTAELYVISNCELREEIPSSMRTICEHYGVKMIQLKDIDKRNGHPTIKGMRQIADQVKQGI